MLLVAYIKTKTHFANPLLRYQILERFSVAFTANGKHDSIS